jgi:hypothetical protein
MMRNKSGVFIKGHIALPAEMIKDSQQTGMFLVDTRPHKIDDGNVMTRPASRTESMAKHEPEGSFQQGKLSALLRRLAEGKLPRQRREFCAPSELLGCARKKAFNLRPVNGVRL